jgi:hypothetical protein
MTDAIQVLKPGWRALDADGVTYSGAVLHFFDAGTSNTRTVYSNYGLSSSLGTTVTCDSGGFPTSDGSTKVEIYTGTSAYKVTLKDSFANTIWTIDNIVGALDTSPFAAAAFAAPDTDCTSDTTDTTLTTDDLGDVRNGNPTGGTFTYTLPSAITASNGKGYTIRHVGTANYIIIAPVLAQTINGLTSLELHNRYQSATLVSDGANWHVMNSDRRNQGDGQCILTLSGGSLLLSPRDGNQLLAPDYPMHVQSGGATLAVTGLSTSTLYYIYAYAITGGVALEASATAYAVDTLSGMRIKNGDRTRRLVGMAYVTSGGAFADSATQRFVRSYFNDPGSALLNAFTANRTTSSTTYVEVNSEIRVEFISWTGEVVHAAAQGKVGGTTSGNIAETSIGFDGTTAEDTQSYHQTPSGTEPGTMSVSVHKSSLAEGYHYATLLGKTVGVSTAIYFGTGTAGTRTALKGFLRR